MLTLTIATPEEHIADANQFARCIGNGPDDDKTFCLPFWQDADGNLYAVASGLVGIRFVEVATGPLQEPAWGCDMDAARRAQARIRMNAPASPDAIVAAFSSDPLATVANMGLQITEMPDV